MSISHPRILVAIADFGGRNTLPQVKQCFSNRAKVVTFSTVEGEYIFPKSIGEALPFTHRNLFIDEVNNYDFFIFTENDILYPDETLDTYFNNYGVFGQSMPLGFLRYEQDQLIDFAATQSPSKIANIDFDKGFFEPKNVHQASYFLTQNQLKMVIDSGKYAVAASARGNYGKLETGASNVYFECGLTKVYPIKGLSSLSVIHLDLKWKLLQRRYLLSHLEKEIVDLREKTGIMMT